MDQGERTPTRARPRPRQSTPAGQRRRPPRSAPANVGRGRAQIYNSESRQNEESTMHVPPRLANLNRQRHATMGAATSRIEQSGEEPSITDLELDYGTDAAQNFAPESTQLPSTFGHGGKLKHPTNIFHNLAQHKKRPRQDPYDFIIDSPARKRPRIGAHGLSVSSRQKRAQSQRIVPDQQIIGDVDNHSMEANEIPEATEDNMPQRSGRTPREIVGEEATRADDEDQQPPVSASFEELPDTSVADDQQGGHTEADNTINPHRDTEQHSDQSNNEVKKRIVDIENIVLGVIEARDDAGLVRRTTFMQTFQEHLEHAKEEYLRLKDSDSEPTGEQAEALQSDLIEIRKAIEANRSQRPDQLKRSVRDLYAFVVPPFVLLIKATVDFYCKDSGNGAAGLKKILDLLSGMLEILQAPRKWGYSRKTASRVIKPATMMIGKVEEAKSAVNKILADQRRADREERRARQVDRDLEEAKRKREDELERNKRAERDREESRRSRIENERRQKERARQNFDRVERLLGKDLRNRGQRVPRGVTPAVYKFPDNTYEDRLGLESPVERVRMFHRSRGTNPSGSYEGSRSHTISRIESVNQWSNEELLALADGLEKFQGTDRYPMIMQIYGQPDGPLKFRNWDEVFQKAREIRAEMESFCDSHEGEGSVQERWPWLMTV